MRKHEKLAYIGLSALVLLIVVTLIFFVCRTGNAETVPSPNASALVALDGGLSLTGAEPDIRIAECLRVDVLYCEENWAVADLTLPKLPPGIMDAALFDGWHLIHARWEEIGETTLRLRFWAEDLARLDCTVGVYLVILAER